MEYDTATDTQVLEKDDTFFALIYIYLSIYIYIYIYIYMYVFFSEADQGLGL